MIVADVTLRAPIAIPVEVRADGRRAFRLAAAIGEDGLRLDTRLPFEAGRMVEARLQLPDGTPLALPARLAGHDGDPADELLFVEPPADVRRAIHLYVVDRLELPA
jgi:hypothetical protein